MCIRTDCQTKYAFLFYLYAVLVNLNMVFIIDISLNVVRNRQFQFGNLRKIDKNSIF